MKELEVKSKIEELLTSVGWKLKHNFELGKSSEDFIIKPIFFSKIRELNQDIELTEKDLYEVHNKLINAPRKQILNYLKNGVPIILEKYNFKKTLKLIDFFGENSNSLILGKEVVFKAGEKSIRTDYALFVNGIPLVVIEAQSTEEDEWERGLRQLTNYCKDMPKLFKLVQVGVIVADNVYYFPFDKEILDIRTVDLLKKKLNVWKPDEDRKTDSWEKILQATLTGLLNPETLLEIVKYFTFYWKNENKVIPRYYQYYTVKKLYEKFVKRLKGRSEERSWTVWHYQGTGKTMEMVYLSYLIMKRLSRKLAPEPVVLIVLDRTELQSQTIENFFQKLELDLGFPVRKVRSFKDLILNIFKKGEAISPGVYTVLIQKFRKRRESEEWNLKEILELPPDTKLEKFKKKRDIFIFVDEAHRSHYGELNKTLVNLFESAFYVAFTGTPKLSKDKSTFLKFGDPIDVYFIDEAEADGYILPVYYKANYDIIRLTLERFVEDRKNYEELMEKILEGEIEEDLDAIEREVVESKIRKMAASVKKLVFENEKRISVVSKVIAEHFKNEVEPKGFKALVVVASRVAAVRYRKYLSRFLGEDEVEALITHEGSEDDPEIRSYFECLVKKYGRKSFRTPEDINEAIKERFQEKENPKVLVVVNKLISGFDERKLQTIYIDRFLSGHTLLQAIGRCNRRYDAKRKVAGLVIDFVGIIDRLKKALFLYFAEKKIRGETKEMFSIVKDVSMLSKVLKSLVDKFDKSVFERIGKDMNDSVKEFFRILERKDGKELERFVSEITYLLIAFDLASRFEKLFKAFESYLISPVASELSEERMDGFSRIYKFLFVINRSLSLVKGKEERIEDLKRIASIKFRKLLEEIEANTLIEKFLESEKAELERMMEKFEEEGYLALSELYKELQEKKSEKALAKAVTVMSVIKAKRREYVPLISTILERVKELNKKKFKAYQILAEILPDVRKILELEKTKKEFRLGEDEAFIYRVLTSKMKVGKEEGVTLTKRIYGKIAEAKKFIERNDFPQILGKSIRLGVKGALRGKLRNEEIEEVIREVKEYYAQVFRECEGLL